MPLIEVHLDREVFDKAHEGIGNAIHDAQTLRAMVRQAVG